MSTFKTAFKMFIYMTLLTGFAYPLLMTGIAQLTMPKLANGSLLLKDKQIMGSALIAQKTTDERYFWPRPSAIDYDPMKPSGGSNLGPTSLELKKEVEERKKKIGNEAPSDLLYASGSGLDPHISIQAAYFQASRIAKARSFDSAEIKALIDSLVEERQLGFLGPRHVNVLFLNHALDEHNDRRRR